MKAKMARKLCFLLFCTMIMVSCDDPNNTIINSTKYNVHYNGNGNTSGSVPMDNNLYLSGEEAIILDKSTLQKSGYVFRSWNTNQQGNGTSYNGGDKILIVSANITLYAIWDELGKYTVAFETYDGSSVQALENIVHGSKITRPSNPTKAHSTFEGWFIDENFTIEWDFQNDVVENNITLYAKWRSTLYLYEITDIYHLQIGFYIVIYWTNPSDDNFSHVRIIPAGYEWADSSALDKEPGTTSYSVMDFANTEYLIIKCIDKNGNISEGIKYYITDKATPVIDDFNISGLGTFIYDGNPKEVMITPKEGSSQGAITVYYNGLTTLPVEEGTYIVTFDVPATTGFNEAKGLTAGSIIIISPRNPLANDFVFSGLGSYDYDGNPKEVTITPKEGSSKGIITVYYNGSTTVPINVGTYTVTFDVAMATGFNAVTGLTAGILIINEVEYYLGLSTNSEIRGNVSVTPPLNSNNLVSGNISILAEPKSIYEFAYWLVNGENIGATNPMNITITGHTQIQAVFTTTFYVNNLSDSANSAITEGTLRYAITNVLDGEFIIFTGINSQNDTIRLTAALPMITKSISIEGNGVTITRDSSWTDISDTSQLLYISGSTPRPTVSLNRIHFKGGRATNLGAAIHNLGNLTLKSCIFSGNWVTTYSASGGAIFNGRNMNVYGCNFYNNAAGTGYGTHGGAIHHANGTLTLVGNLFYRSDAEYDPIVYRSSGTIISHGYNIIDNVPGYIWGAGWDVATGDTKFTDLGISGVPFDTSTFIPVSGLRNIIPDSPLTDFPTLDFFGETRNWPGTPGAVN